MFYKYQGLVDVFEVGVGIHGYLFYVFVLNVCESCKSFGSSKKSISCGGSKDNRKLHWISWDQVLADKTHGGLDIGSLVSFNFSLLQKWRWRFHTEELLWFQVIKKIYGEYGGFE